MDRNFLGVFIRPKMRLRRRFTKQMFDGRGFTDRTEKRLSDFHSFSRPRRRMNENNRCNGADHTESGATNTIRDADGYWSSWSRDLMIHGQQRLLTRSHRLRPLRSAAMDTERNLKNLTLVLRQRAKFRKCSCSLLMTESNLSVNGSSLQ